MKERGDWTANALMRNIRKRGANAFPIDLSEISAEISSQHGDKRTVTALLNEDGLSVNFDAFIVRDIGGIYEGGTEGAAFRYDLLRILSEQKLMMNTPNAIQIAADKFMSMRIFADASLPVPRTVVTKSVEVALDAIRRFGGAAVAKPIFGYQGKGVEKICVCTSEVSEAAEMSEAAEDSEAERRIKRIIAARGVIYLQEFIRNPMKRDIRVFVVDGEAVAAIYRVRHAGISDEVASNLSMGGMPVKCDITSEMSEIAVKAAEVIGADFAGVDLIESTDNLYLLEINGTPSARGIKIACGIDVTERIVEMLIRRLKQ